VGTLVVSLDKVFSGRVSADAILPSALLLERCLFARGVSLEHVDNLGAYRIPLEIGFLIPSDYDN